MKVKQLIKLLEETDPNAKVYVVQGNDTSCGDEIDDVVHQVISKQVTLLWDTPLGQD
jgi:hypothetical protein